MSNNTGIVMTAVTDIHGNIIGMEPLQANIQLQSVSEDGSSEAIDVTSAFTGKDLTTSGEIELTTSDTSVATEDIGKGVIIGHPIHLDVKSVGTDVTIPEQDWDGGEW